MTNGRGSVVPGTIGNYAPAFVVPWFPSYKEGTIREPCGRPRVCGGGSILRGRLKVFQNTEQCEGQAFPARGVSSKGSTFSKEIKHATRRRTTRVWTEAKAHRTTSAPKHVQGG